jgi:hypothetical protein
MTGIDLPGLTPIWTATSIIMRFSNYQSKGSATGFFYANNSDLYLITNKHVIYGNDIEHGNPIIDTIKLNLHTNVNNLSQNEEVTIQLFEGRNKKWLEHEHPGIDVIALPITLDRTKYVILSIDNTYMDLKTRQGQIIVDDFEKIFLMGYPFGWYDTINNLPITRIGHLSSPFRVPFNGMPLMMGDLTSHQGMSGGPVFMFLKDFTVEGQLPSMLPRPGQTQPSIGRIKMMGQNKVLLVGINSGQFVPPTEERVDLISIWFPDVIPEIIGRAGI